MSRKALRKDLRMEVRRNRGRYLSIFLIVALGVAFFSGLRASESDMRYTADGFADSCSLMDVRVVSTMGLTDDDLEALSSLPGVETAEASNMKYVLTTKNDTDYVIELTAMPQQLNTIQLTEGRMPETAGECIADNRLKKNGYALGDTIEVRDGEDGDLSDCLTEISFEIVGFGDSPMYLGLERGSATIGSGQVSGFAVVQPEVFDQDYYTQIFLTASGAADEISFTDAYTEIAQALKRDAEALEEERCQARYDEILKEAREPLEEAQAEYDEQKEKADRELADARTQLDDGWAQLEEAKAQAADQQSRLEDGQAQLEEKEKELASSRSQLDGIEAQLAQSRSEIEEGFAQLEEARAKLDETQAELNEKEQEYADSKAEAESELADAKKQLEDGWEELNDIKLPEWYVTDRDDLPGYTDYGSNAERIGAIGKVFPAIFFLVAALVALTAVTRMVEEQRTQIGTYKALGYSKKDIIFKYLSYALSAALGGSVAGVLVGEKLFPFVIIISYRIMYTPLLNVIIPYNMEYAVLSILLAVVSIGAATLAACSHALSASPAVLMRPVAPKPGKRVFLERIGILWKHLSFSQKATLRNLFRYKKRFVMTVFGIGCCCGLMVVGFGLKDSIMNIASIQYDNIQLYDAMVSTQEDMTEAEQEELEQKLAGEEGVRASVRVMMKSMDASTDSAVRTAYVVVAEDVEALEEMMVFRSRETHETYHLEDAGVVISEQLSGALDVKENDSFTLRFGDTKLVHPTVLRVAENYLMHYIYMTEAEYEALFGEKPEYNMYWLDLTQEGKLTEEELGQELMDLSGVLTVTYVSSTRNMIENMLDSLYIIVIVLVISASLLAFVVIYNLNNINISERRRELATIKLLGFYDMEVAGYVYRENIYLTLIGAVAGLGIGKLLHSFVINTIEVNQVMFGRQVSAMSYFWCIVLTIVFSAFVNFVMYFQLKKIDMVESLKSVD